MDYCQYAEYENEISSSRWHEVNSLEEKEFDFSSDEENLDLQTMIALSLSTIDDCKNVDDYEDLNDFTEKFHLETAISLSLSTKVVSTLTSTLGPISKLDLLPELFLLILKKIPCMKTIESLLSTKKDYRRMFESKKHYFQNELTKLRPMNFQTDYFPAVKSRMLGKENLKIKKFFTVAICDKCSHHSKNTVMYMYSPGAYNSSETDLFFFESNHELHIGCNYNEEAKKMLIQISRK